MSASLDKLGAAVEKALYDELGKDGEMATGYLAVVTCLNADGDQEFVILKPKGQTITATTGMLELARLYNGADIMAMRGT